MAQDWQDPDEEDDDYFAEIFEEAELTGKEPKFVDVPALKISPSDLSQMKVDDLVAMYRAIRDQAATESKSVKQRKEKLKLHMSIVGLLLRDKGDTLGVDSFTTPNGTAYRHRVEKMRIGNWDETAAYVLRTGNIHILQHRVSPNAVKEVRQVDGELPPGIECTEEVTFSVRSPAARKRNG